MGARPLTGRVVRTAAVSGMPLVANACPGDEPDRLLEGLVWTGWLESVLPPVAAGGPVVDGEWTPSTPQAPIAERAASAARTRIHRRQEPHEAGVRGRAVARSLGMNDRIVMDVSAYSVEVVDSDHVRLMAAHGRGEQLDAAGLD